MRCTKAAQLSGLFTKSVASTSKARSTARSSPRPVIMMIGVFVPAGNALKRSQTPKPSSPGISTSRRTRSGVSDSNKACACSPPSATTTVKPLPSRASRAISRVIRSSSTTSILFELRLSQAIFTPGSGSELISKSDNRLCTPTRVLHLHQRLNSLINQTDTKFPDLVSAQKRAN